MFQRNYPQMEPEDDDDIIEIDDIVESWWSELAEAEMQPMPDRGMAWPRDSSRDPWGYPTAWNSGGWREERQTEETTDRQCGGVDRETFHGDPGPGTRSRQMEQTGVLEKAQEIRDEQRKETEDAEWLEGGVQRKETEDAEWLEGGVNEETLLTSMKQWSLEDEEEDEPLLTFERCTDDLCHLFKNVIFHPALGRHCRDWKEGATQGVVDGLLQHLMQPEDVAIYVDGSFRRDFGVGGWAFTVYRQGLNLHSASGYVEERFATAFTMEAVAVTEALLWLTTRTRELRKKSVFFLSDCQRLLTMVQDGVCVEEWLSAAGSLTVKDVTWIYCPAHCGVKGNAEADLLAKEAWRSAL